LPVLTGIGSPVLGTTSAAHAYSIEHF